jgi:exonuclease III
MPQESSGYFSARAEALAAQFHETGLHVVGLQETRSRLAGHARLQDFHVLSASATQRGVGGVQLWIRRTIQTRQMCLQVEDSHLYILHATSQRLIVRWTTGHLRLILLVLHAPTTDDEGTLEAFWKATTEALPRKYRSWRMLLFADANSRVGSVTSVAIGDHQAVEENTKGAHFHQWLLQHNLMLPQTFAAFHQGDGHTWTHPSGAPARLDYIAIPTAMADSFTRTWLDENIDLAIHREDHVLVRAQVNVPVLPLVKRKPPEVKSPAGVPHMAWATDVHTHAAALQAWMRHQQVPEVRFRKAHLTDDTRKLIQAKKFHRKHLLQLRTARRRAFLVQIFDSWRTSTPVDGHFRD